jgi:hypothetical protein
MGIILKRISVLNYAPQHEELCGSGVYFQEFLTSALDGDEWSVSSSDRFASLRRRAVSIG